MWGEIIEEHIKLARENGEAKPDPHDIALAAADTIYAQGNVHSVEVDLLVDQLTQQATYLLA